MSAGFHAKTLTLSHRNLTSASSYLTSRLAPMRAIFFGLPSTSWTSLCSLDLVLFLGVSCSGSLSWSGDICVACATVSGTRIGRSIASVILKLSSSQVYASHLASRLALMRAVFSGLPSTSWTSLCSLDLVLFLGVFYSGSLSWSGDICVACATVSAMRIERLIASVILKLSSS